MLYIKIMKDDTIIAVEAHPNPVYVYKQRNGAVVRCPKTKAQGILSIDTSVIYQLEGKEKLESTTLTAASITKTEFLNLVESLDEPPQETPDTEADPAPDTEDGEKVMTSTEMRERIIDLETRNEVLEECVLEMSTIVYA